LLRVDDEFYELRGVVVCKQLLYGAWPKLKS